MAEKTKMITSIGGQALMEGIMMRGPKITSVGVRLPNGEIGVSERPTENLRDRWPILGLPIIRGVASMIDSMRIGYQALNESAEKSIEGNSELNYIVEETDGSFDSYGELLRQVIAKSN